MIDPERSQPQDQGVSPTVLHKANQQCGQPTVWRSKPIPFEVGKGSFIQHAPGVFYHRTINNSSKDPGLFFNKASRYSLHIG